ncbi:hypothetical protein [Streptomyces mirabilis]|uniref:hypothetical protein n=1 Tax=Streptomyces mirabilis TaxID=68239 RepID=UPI00224C960B|nr:hypothetical protein [Streptomyces mirabilis]MCX4419649.1 hypothetical protein [Streptomyces mirabilis]
MTVRLFPVSAPSETLLTLIPSAQIDVILLFCTFPPAPEAQKPDMVCWVQMPSMWKLRTVQEVRSNSAAGGVPLGTGTSR